MKNNKRDLKFTRNFITKNVGLKIDGKRISRNSNLNIVTNFVDTEKPVVFFQGSKRDNFYMFDLENNKKTNLKDLEVYLSKKSIYSEMKGKYGYDEINSVLMEKDGYTYLYQGNKMYSTEKDYVRIENLGNKMDASEFSNMYVLIDKDFNHTIVGNFQSVNKYSEQKTIDFDKITHTAMITHNEINPYVYLLLSGKSLNPHKSDKRGVDSKNVIKHTNDYYKTLINNAESKEMKKDLISERSKFLKSLTNHFADESEMNIEVIKEKQLNIKEMNKEVKVLKDKIVEESKKGPEYHRGKAVKSESELKLSKLLHDKETSEHEIEYAKRFINETKKIENSVLNNKNDKNKETLSIDKITEQSREVGRTR